MRKLSFPKIKQNIRRLSEGGFKQIFSRIDQMGIKKGVDEMGIERFVNQCALMAAGSGLVTGVGGLGSMLIGIPLDIINLITQQFRVTLAISYHQTGRYEIRFEDFFKIIARSLKADTKLALSKNIMEEVAERLLLSVGSKTYQRLVPIVGGIVGGAVNYYFIKGVAKTLQQP
ncbi:hypothetical protein C7T94_10825 [Pedobacter yulinensis]|uniref:EcsC family protein n=1 Tax=Pedobacter yulinensis TaxID=2126353 RepID=A0A2T3HKY9_9SPHI|nr:hypothetical protein [Pedobacter yulinensis]PST83100.1 hypothetical protein C7T94_10825 [Pedobacter yulinensis]